MSRKEFVEGYLTNCIMRLSNNVVKNIFYGGFVNGT